jgi:hypothetical protein
MSASIEALGMAGSTCTRRVLTVLEVGALPALSWCTDLHIAGARAEVGPEDDQPHDRRAQGARVHCQRAPLRYRASAARRRLPPLREPSHHQVPGPAARCVQQRVLALK